MPITPTSVRLPPETLAQLDALAARLGLRGRRSEVIRLAVAELARRTLGEAAPPDAERRERRGRPRRAESASEG